LLINQGGTGQTTALEILRMRYAKGEIIKEEYEEKKKTALNSSRECSPSLFQLKMPKNPHID